VNTTIFVVLFFVVICVAGWLVLRALRDFNEVEAGGNVGKAGFFIKAKRNLRNKK